MRTTTMLPGALTTALAALLSVLVLGPATESARIPGEPAASSEPAGPAAPARKRSQARDVLPLAVDGPGRLARDPLDALRRAFEDSGAAAERGPVLRPRAAGPRGSSGCTLPDPTRRGGCLTVTTLRGLEALAAEFGGWRDGPVIRSASCWDAHAWNPASDHPHGRACDLFPSAPGTFPHGEELANGWRVANWFRARAESLRVKYVIWQGRYWDPTVPDRNGGWGEPYTGGGVYDVRDATGGHYDHLHVSFAE
ncbi:hypothetical protein ACFQE5_15650 [Pseudonocardia hispaniensis]|uniref:ARB-07466-like C-terminal domain-containing protein n=1 Tax=Pseudonocardia hispaniensis TaxID=904933 RepID=A0ABW1J569_9PSEU